MATSVAQSIAGHLAASGVTHAFGVPGEHCLAIVDAIARHPDMNFVSTRHESGAAFMAEAHGKLTGTPAACLATASVGASNMLAGVNVAAHDSTPFIGIIGQVDTGYSGREAWQEMDFVGTFTPVAKDAIEVTNPDLVPEVIMRAVRISTCGRPGPVILSVPVDVQQQPVGGTEVTDPGSDFRPAISQQAVEAAATTISSAARPLVVAGGGVVRSGAVDDLVTFAELTSAPVATSFRRPDAFPSRHEHSVGSFGLSATPALRQLASDADLIIAIGTRLSELTTSRYHYPSAKQGVVHIDVDATTLATQPFSHALRIESDAGSALRALNRTLPPDVTARGRWWEGDDRDAIHDYPEFGAGTGELARAAREIDGALPSEAVVTSDAGDFFVTVARHLGFFGQRRYLGPTSGTMGYGLPSAISAKLSRPRACVVAFVGDGGFMMTCHELETAVRLGLGMTVVVFNDSAYGSIRRHQADRFGGRLTGSLLTSVDFAALADSIGAHGVRADSNTDYRKLIADADDGSVPVVVEIVKESDRP